MASISLQAIKLIIFLLVLSGLAACSTPGTYMNPYDMQKSFKVGEQTMRPQFVALSPAILLQERQTFREYQVGAQDVLTIIVWNHPELTIPSLQTSAENVTIYTHGSEANNVPAGILVNNRGRIFFPLAGILPVAKKTVEEVRLAITRRLNKYIRNPQVSVRVSAFRSKPIYIIGEVMRPGIQPITDMPMTIMDAINQSGGLDKESSDTHYIYVIRGSFANPQVFWLDASSPSAILMAETFNLAARDIVLVSTAGVARWSRVVNKILPTVQTLMNPVFKNDD